MAKFKTTLDSVLENVQTDGKSTTRELQAMGIYFKLQRNDLMSWERDLNENGGWYVYLADDGRKDFKLIGDLYKEEDGSYTMYVDRLQGKRVENLKYFGHIERALIDGNLTDNPIEEIKG